MHIADGFLSPEVCAVTGALSLGAVGYSVRRMQTDLTDRAVPLTGMTAALIFAGQMVNFPLIAVPVSGHLIGGVLAAVLLGPWAGCVALTLVLLVQCLLFADGGLTALGANVLNMAVLGCWGGYGVYSFIRQRFGNTAQGTLIATVVASWLTVVASSVLFGLEFWASSVSMFQGVQAFNYGQIFTLMVTVHSGIGIGEALITGLVVSFVLQQRPALLLQPEQAKHSVGQVAVAGVVLALAVAAFLAPFASGHPDGLEAVAERAEFLHLGDQKKQITVYQDHEIPYFEDYEIPLPAVGERLVPVWEKVSVTLAGLLGTGAVLLLGWLFSKSIGRRTLILEPHE